MRIPCCAAVNSACQVLRPLVGRKSKMHEGTTSTLFDTAYPCLWILCVGAANNYCTAVVNSDCPFAITNTGTKYGNVLHAIWMEHHASVNGALMLLTLNLGRC